MRTHDQDEERAVPGERIGLSGDPASNKPRHRIFGSRAFADAQKRKRYRYCYVYLTATVRLGSKSYSECALGESGE
eukprot:9056532-Pyramimonas_sp.AAC.1